MKSIKVFDYFQKFSYDDVSKPTSIGAFISFLAICSIIFFIFFELFEFFSLHLKKDFIIYQEESSKSKIEVYFSLDIPHSPCSILSVDQEDKLGIHKTNIVANITKKRISKADQNAILPPIVPHKTDELLKALNEDEGCLIEGFMEVNKVPGNIHISFHPYRNVFENLFENHKEEFKKLRLMHKFNYLSFGDKNIPLEELNSFSIYPHTKMPDFINNDNKEPNYDYFIKIIPHLIRNEADNTIKLNYQYSLRFGNRNSEEKEMAMIMINYDMSEVTTLITKKKRNYTHFLTNICAIVGGIYVIFSIINKIVLNMFDFSQKEF